MQGSRLDSEPMAGKPKEKQLDVSFLGRNQMMRQVMSLCSWAPKGTHSQVTSPNSWDVAAVWGLTWVHILIAFSEH